MFCDPPKPETPWARMLVNKMLPGGTPMNGAKEHVRDTKCCAISLQLASVYGTPNVLRKWSWLSSSRQSWPEPLKRLRRWFRPLRSI